MQTNARKEFFPKHSNLIHREKADQCMMYTDRIRLSQVIISFTNNALKFTPKGSIEMGYRIEEAKDEIYFYVKDTGIGIPADKIDKVFEQLRQTELLY